MYAGLESQRPGAKRQLASLKTHAEDFKNEKTFFFSGKVPPGAIELIKNHCYPDKLEFISIFPTREMKHEKQS